MLAISIEVLELPIISLIGYIAGCLTMYFIYKNKPSNSENTSNP